MGFGNACGNWGKLAGRGLTSGLGRQSTWLFLGTFFGELISCSPAIPPEPPVVTDWLPKTIKNRLAWLRPRKTCKNRGCQPIAIRWLGHFPGIDCVAPPGLDHWCLFSNQFRNSTVKKLDCHQSPSQQLVCHIHWSIPEGRDSLGQSHLPDRGGDF